MCVPGAVGNVCGCKGVCACVQTRPVPAELPLPSAGLLSQSLEFSSPADNYTVCEGDNATLRYLPSRGLRSHPVRLLQLPQQDSPDLHAQPGPCPSGEVVGGRDSGPGSVPGPQCPHLSNGWRSDNHCQGCHADARFCTRARHTVPASQMRAGLISPDRCCSPQWVRPSLWASVPLSLGLSRSSLHPCLSLPECSRYFSSL